MPRDGSLSEPGRSPFVPARESLNYSSSLSSEAVSQYVFLLPACEVGNISHPPPYEIQVASTRATLVGGFLGRGRRRGVPFTYSTAVLKSLSLSPCQVAVSATIKYVLCAKGIDLVEAAACLQGCSGPPLAPPLSQGARSPQAQGTCPPTPHDPFLDLPGCLGSWNPLP